MCLLRLIVGQLRTLFGLRAVHVARRPECCVCMLLVYRQVTETSGGYLSTTRLLTATSKITFLSQLDSIGVDKRSTTTTLPCLLVVENEVNNKVGRETIVWKSSLGGLGLGLGGQRATAITGRACASRRAPAATYLINHTRHIARRYSRGTTAELRRLVTRVPCPEALTVLFRQGRTPKSSRR